MRRPRGHHLVHHLGVDLLAHGDTRYGSPPAQAHPRAHTPRAPRAVASFGYYQATGSWPDLSNGEDQAKVGASVFAFVNVARFLVPLRVGLALSTVPWVDDNIVNPFIDKFGGDADDAEKEQ